MCTKHEQVAVSFWTGRSSRRNPLPIARDHADPRGLVCWQFHLLCTARIRSARTDLWSQ